MLSYLIVLFCLLTFIMVFNQNTFNCLMNLVLLFIIGSLISLFLGLEYIGLVTLLIYVGALAILFLFVIMLLDIKGLEFKSLNYQKNITVFLGFIILLIIYLSIINNTRSLHDTNLNMMSYNTIYNMHSINLLETLGKILYNNHIEILIIISVTLTIALIGSLAIII
jgi:NADH-quinone oxidoreductase subunit J